MSQVNELSLALDELTASAERMIQVASFLRRRFSSEPEPNSPQPEEEAVPDKVYTFVEVRKAFAAKSHEGFTDQVRALISRYGADKLSAISESDYPALMKDLEAIT